MTECPVPTLTMVVRRYVALHPVAGFCLDLFRDLEHFVTATIERSCTGDGFRGLGLTTDLPEGADIRYTFGKDRGSSSHVDPRTQAVEHHHESESIEIGCDQLLITPGQLKWPQELFEPPPSPFHTHLDMHSPMFDQHVLPESPHYLDYIAETNCTSGFINTLPGKESEIIKLNSKSLQYARGGCKSHGPNNISKITFYLDQYFVNE